MHSCIQVLTYKALNPTFDHTSTKGFLTESPFTVYAQRMILYKFARSSRGPVGDAIEDMDNALGVVMDALRKSGTENSTHE